MFLRHFIGFFLDFSKTGDDDDGDDDGKETKTKTASFWYE
jgi:hypothetical protein